MASFLEKGVVYRLPHPGLHIEGVPDEDEQAIPRQEDAQLAVDAGWACSA